MNSRHVPIEADCDVCGKTLELGEIARNHDRHTGTTVCDNCAKISRYKHLDFED